MSVKTPRKAKVKPAYKITAAKKVRTSAPKTASRSNWKYSLAAYEQLHVGIVVSSPKGKYIDVNKEFCRILGYSKKELLQLGVRDCTHEDDYSLDIKLHGQLIAGEIPFYALEKRFVRKDGGIVWVELTRSLVRDDDGKSLYAIGAVIDISEQKNVERALRESVESLRLATEAARMFKWELDIQKQFYTFADNFEQVLGFSASLLPQGNLEVVLQLSPREDAQAVLEAIDKAVATGTDLKALQFRVFHPENGQIVWLEINAKVIGDDRGNPQRLLGVAQNITEEKQREEELKELNRRIKRQHDVFEMTLSSVQDPIYRFDRSGRILYANQSLLDVWGLKGEDAVGRSMADLNYPKDVEQSILEGIEQVFATKQTVKNETYYISPAGVSGYYENILTPVFAEDGTVEVVIGSSRNITERKRAEQTLSEYARQQAALYQLADQLHRTSSLDDVFNAALDAILSAVQCERASILLFDETGVMRFVAWRGLSDAYRQATQGHSPWAADEKNPFPVCCNDVRSAEFGEALKTAIQAEGIGALAFIPVVSNGKLIGKFMLYANAPHEYSDAEIELSLMIARQLAFGIDRIKAEKTLRQSEERFVRFMQHLPGLAWIKDIEGRYVYVNAAAEKAFGAPREKLYGRNDREIFPAQVAAEFQKNDRQALASEKGMQTVETLQQEDGVLHYSLVSKFPIPGPDGNPMLIGGTAFDITERLRAEEALHESEQRLRAILSQATAGILRQDAKGRLIFVNQAFCNMLGYTESELLGEPIWKFTHSEDVEENQRLFDRLMLEGVPFKLEKRLIRSDGSVIWMDVSVSPIMSVAGKPQSAVAVEVDISARKQAEEALQQLNLQLESRVQKRTATIQAINQTLRDEIAERKRIEEALRQSEAAARASEEKLHTLFDLLPVGISFLDPQGQILQMNSALPSIKRLTKEQLLGRTYKARKYLRPDGTLMPPEEFASARALRENRTVYNVETGVLLENGQMIWTSVSAAPVNVADVGVVVVTIDITDSKRAEQALQESHARLRILSQRLVEVQEEERRALARELHDRVGQTLAALNINLIIINSQISPDNAQLIGARLNDSMKLVAETIALVRDVMTDLRPAVLDDYGLEAALESQLSKFTSRYNIKATFEKPDHPTPRLGASIEMTFLRIAQEALINIARHAYAKHVSLSLRQEEQSVCLTIQDDGIGIDSWQEANRPGSHGLTIMRERAEAFGGRLKVKSAPNQGTLVEVSIPCKGNIQDQAQQEILL